MKSWVMTPEEIEAEELAAKIEEQGRQDGRASRWDRDLRHNDYYRRGYLQGVDERAAKEAKT